MWNRHGDRLTIAKEFEHALDLLGTLPFDWLDCETLARRHEHGKGTIIVLDIVAPNEDYEQRRAGLEVLFPVAPLDPASTPENEVLVLPSWQRDVAQVLWEDLPRWNLGTDPAHWFWEGMVAKRGDSTYPIQLRSPGEKFSGWQKFRYDW